MDVWVHVDSMGPAWFIMNVLKIDIRRQQLWFFHDRCLQTIYPISTASQGVGQNLGSMMTPKGWHQLRAKIGDKLPADTVFKGRRDVGRYADLVAGKPDQDWILARVLWLSGLEPGVNRLGNVDTMQRYIYIHGTPDVIDGVPRSMGCIRMRCDDVVALYDRLELGDRVYIHAAEKGEE